MPISSGTGVWPPEMGVHKVVWNSGNGPENVGLLASATASGLVRIDTKVWGRWVKGKRFPYGGVLGARLDAAAEVGDDESEEDDDDDE